ncbi:MAG: nitrous oxide-stimulated promoter family protein [Planctomycetes bacterium]|nr:nitrous oxide-stimulated promoter family protein [Planctomycetota bacterium]
MQLQEQPAFTGRLAREHELVQAMIAVHCRDAHGSRTLCASCAEIAEYADQRLARCPFGAEKPTCAKCSVHCYRRDMRERVREVMRSSGPKMLVHHPWLAFLHEVVDSRRPTPELPRKRATS